MRTGIVARAVCLFVWAGAMFASSASAAELALSRHFSDNMVLQREKPVVISGTAGAGAQVGVTFAGQTETATADDEGAWSVTLDAMPANATGQRLMCRVARFRGPRVVLENVVVGDVILFARQTSIDISLGRDAEGRRAAAGIRRNPLLRAISIKTIPAGEPQEVLSEEATTGWSVVDPGSALKMSAAACYLGRDLAPEVDVPVGIIDLNMGSAFPISWLGRGALEQTETFYGRSDVPGQIKYYDKMMDAIAKEGKAEFKGALKSDPLKYALFPSGGYNAVLHPLKGLALKGALVQLGNDYPYMIYAGLEQDGKRFDRKELNRAYVETYNIRKVGFRMESVTTPRVPREWRKILGDEGLPMGLVVPPGSDLNTLGQHHREMRELQRLTAEGNPGVGIVLPGSENVPYSAQPSDEELLAKRSLSWVLGSVYERPGVAATGPLFESIDAHFNEATVYFKEGTATGLEARGDALDYFEAAAVEGDYSPAEASIDGDVIRIKSDTVTRIVRVRYNWSKRPDQGLVNAAGLPAVPFRSEKAGYHWFVTNKDDDLPIEYSTPANEWEKNDVTLVNAQLKTHGYGNFTGWLGPVGVRTGPFGPNMGVREVKSGSPADGKVFVGDVIYSANGEMLGEKAWEVMGQAITDSETRGGEGRLVLGLRRGGENIDVEVGLEVMGTYSSTAPYDCPKTEKIIADLEEWVVSRGAGAGFLNTDAIFMLATGDPDMQGYVRRIIYNNIMARRDPSKPADPKRAGKSWHNSAEGFLLAEYYHATGDRNVLPYLKHVCDRLAVTQNQEYGGWRHNFPGGATYGLIPNAGLPGVIGMNLALKAGLDISKEAYELSLRHYSKGKAETGFLIYGFGKCERPVPTPFDPDKFLNGKLSSFNGGISAAGILMGLAENHRAAHLCSLISAYAWNNTFGGHGGNFWNNFWTPLGAHQHSKKAFINFWRNYRWYRESNRMFDGSLIQHESGKVGAGCGVALVAPRRRIQVVGAPPSPFATDAPESLGPALEAYRRRDYAGCEKLVDELLATGTVGKADLPTVEYLARQARDIQASIDADLARMNKLIEEGRPGEARADLAQLTGIMPEGDERLAAVKAAIGSAKPAPRRRPAPLKKVEEEKREWACLVTEMPSTDKRKKKRPDIVDTPEQPNMWKIKVVEGLAQAPDGWTEPEFDAAGWGETMLPISWRMYHTALVRTKFNVEDKDAYDLLRLRAWVFRQQGIEIYLNGVIIGKVNNIERKTGDIANEFKESALKHLRNGENTLAITTRHNWRWGMLFMTVYNDGFDFNLDARLKK